MVLKKLIIYKRLIKSQKTYPTEKMAEAEGR